MAIGGSLAVVALDLSTLVAGAERGRAQASNPYQRGPNPTAAALTAGNGPFATSSTTVSGLGVTGFGGGRIVIRPARARAPSAPWSSPPASPPPRPATRRWQPGRHPRLRRLRHRHQHTLDHPTGTSPVRTRIDASRLAVAGHSMGGGGTLAAANARPGLQAAVSLQPWHTTKSWSNTRVPTMIIGAQADTVASVTSHAEPFHTSIPAASEKAYVELIGECHFAGNSNPSNQGRAIVTWLERYVDNDTSYEQSKCPAPQLADYSECRDTCPGGNDNPTTQACPANPVLGTQNDRADRPIRFPGHGSRPSSVVGLVRASPNQ